MAIVKDFSADINVPYYWPCSFPLVHAKLEHEGRQSSQSLQLNLCLFSLPSYAKNSHDSSSFVSIWEARRLGYLGAGKYLGYTFNTKQYDTLESGMNVLHAAIEQQRPFIVCGTTYHIPHSKDYHSEDYFRDYMSLFLYPNAHWILVYGIDDQDVLVYDPIPNKYQGRMPISDFQKFWEGDRVIPQLIDYPGIEQLSIFGTSEIESIPGHIDLPLEYLMQQCLKTIAYEYMNGDSVIEDGIRYYFGQQAMKQLIEDLKAHLHSADPLSTPIFQMYDKCIFENRFSRYFLKDLLQEMLDLNFTYVSELYNELDSLIKTIENIGNVFKVNVQRKRSKEKVITAFIESAEAFLEQETDFLKRVFEQFQELPLLEKRQSALAVI
ncbi:hypothetical protein [Paenibacillus sp. SI8]|uniref:hypothetical protein n=1 Tax=unclassified Paenibacillus TaxID=185978 RepID=UPI003467937D